MSFLNIKKALIQAYEDGAFGLDTAYENMDFDEPDSATPWAEVFIIPNQPIVFTLGSNGEDRHTGLMQINLYYPPRKGDVPILTKADVIAQHFQAGYRKSYAGQNILVRSCGRSRIRNALGRCSLSLTIEWSAETFRT